MRDKGALRAKLNSRTLKHGVFSALCSLRPARQYFNFYKDFQCFEEAAETGSVRSLVIDPVRDYGLYFTDSELTDIFDCGRREIETSRLTYKMALVRNVTILGSSGVTLDERTGRILFLDDRCEGFSRNWVVARPLKSVHADAAATYVNLLGMRKGHRHFAHFFWDTMVPLMVYLRNWHDPAKRVVCLVREDLSPIQRDAFRFVQQEWPGISFQTLGANGKMHCPKSIYIAYQNPNYGRDNTLARDYMLMVADLFMRHYGITPSPVGEGRRIYVSRTDAVLRRVRNEMEIVETLRGYGFETFVTGRMPFAEQARLFASAEMVVAPHGAALANLMFCRPGTGVLEFFPSNYIDDGMARLSRAMWLDYHYLVGGTGAAPKLAFAVDSTSVEASVRSMLNSRRWQELRSARRTDRRIAGGLH